MKKLPLRLYNTETKKTGQFKTLGTQMGYPIGGTYLGTPKKIYHDY